MIKAEIVADSLSPQGDRLTSLLITFPRIILAEVNTHRMLSKNTSSSRAIPFNKMVEAVENNPFIPIAWQKEHKGMQGTEYFEEPIISNFEGIRDLWLTARDNAIEEATRLNNIGVTKQLCNRLLEPFMWTTMLITGSKESWDNFFELRCGNYDGFKSRKEASKEFLEKGNINTSTWSELDWLKLNKGQAEIHIMDLAEKIYDVMNESTPRQLKAGEWHIPMRNKIDNDILLDTLEDGNFINDKIENYLVKISTAMAARTSCTVVGEEKDLNYSKMIELHDRLIEMRHDSPLEHCARAMSDEEYYSSIKGSFLQEFEIDADGFIDISTHVNNSNSFGWCRNFKGFIPYRHIIETQNE